MNRITQYLPLDDLYPVEKIDEARLFAFDGRDLDPASLVNHHLRHFDPTPGQWLSEDPVGYSAGDDANLRPYVGQ
ncbi:MAG: hypothetical protein WD872_20635 [Pirellulaceae bacterium]